MAVLSNPKHEQLVHNILKEPSVTQAYQATYHTSYSTANKNGYRAVNDGIRNRLLEVMEEQGINDDFITRKLSSLAEHPKGNVQLGTIRTILEVRRDIESTNKIAVQVNVNQEERSKVVNRLNKYKSFMTLKTVTSKSSNDMNDSKNKAK